MAENSNRCSYLLNRIQGFSSNTFKIMPQGSTTATANGLINITLPANCLLNLKSFALFFDASITSAGGDGRLPSNISSLISRYDVKIGGNAIQSGCNFYNVLHNAKHYLGSQKVCPLTEHPEIVCTKSSYTRTGTGNTGITTKLEVANTYAITNWDGFLGTLQPSIIDSGLVGDIVVTIYLADNAVCVDASASAFTLASIGTDTGTPNPVYKLENIYATIETMSMADGTYDQMVSGIIQSRGYLELPFKNYVSFQDTTNSAMRWQNSTQSLDRIWIVHRAANYSNPGGAIFVSGYHTAKDTPQYEGILGYNKQRLISKYFDYEQPADGFKSQMQLNGSLVPQYQGNVYDWAVITKNSLPWDAKEPEWSMNTFKFNYCVYCLRLNLPDSEKQNIISGVNTLGISLNAFYNMYGVTTAETINIFCETTACLKIGTSLQTELVL